MVFEISGSDWYISNVSLKNAQETSFSPDEFILIQEIPRKLASETFDFRFEFYDINNNYIPVDVTAVGTFDGGNDFPTSTKILTINSDRNAFRFVTGSFANPPFQQIGFTTTRQNIVSDIVYGRSVYDLTGSYISEADYLSLGGLEYPGRLHTSSSAGFVVQIDEFSGSLDTGTSGIFRVGFIVYTASAEGLEDFETIYRLEDGDNAPGIFASSTANQFIYKATDLTLNPSNQVITFDVRRKNLGTSGEPITINSGSQFGTAAPLSLLFDDPTTGVATYFLSGSTFNFRSGSATYFFTASDTYDIDYHDTIKITPIKILDGLSVNLTNENATLPAFSTGFVSSGSFALTSGSVSVKVGGEDIVRQEGLTLNNRFDIISATGVNCTPNDTTPDDATYGITTLTADSGSLTLLVRYKDGAGDTTDVTKVVTYSKSKRGVPNVEVSVTPTAQSIQSNSRGSGSATPQSLTVIALEGGTSRFTSIGTPIYTNGLTGTVSTNTITFTSNASSMTSDSGTITIPVNFTDSENVSGTKNIVASVSRVRSSAPVVNISANPQSQTVTSGSLVGIGTSSNVSIIVNEGGSNYTYNTSGANTFNITNVTNGTNNNNGTITPNTPTSISGTSGVITISYRNSEGTSFTGRTIDFEVGVAGIGSSGANGANGANGAAGANGVVINLTPPAQTITRSTSSVYATPATFNVTVSENGTLLTHTTNSSLSNNQFKFSAITNGSLVGGSGTTTPSIRPSTPSTTAGLTTSFTVTYKDSKGTESSAIGQSHVVSVNLDGNTGPGVVHTGVWAAGRAYQYSDGLSVGTGRRDTVLWSSNGSAPYNTYYATNISHTSTNNSSTSTGRPDLGGPWTSLGTQDFFVAAKIGIFEDSFVQNTLNIGTNNNGGVSSANITLAGGSANPYISIGQSGTIGSQGYNINGIFLGQDSGTSKLSLKSSTNSLLWDGTTLTVNGSGNFTGQVTGGTIVGGTINVPNATSPLFSVDSLGRLTATEATIGGWSVNSSGIFKAQSGSTIRLNSSATKIELFEGTSDTRFEVSIGTINDPRTEAVPLRSTIINNGGFVVNRDSERYFRHNTIGGAPFTGKSRVFNDSKGGMRVDGLFFHTPYQSRTFYTGTDNGATTNESLDPTQWLPKTQEAMIYDRPGEAPGAITYTDGSNIYNRSNLRSGGGLSMGGATFRLHTGSPEFDSNYGINTLPLRIRVDETGVVQVLKDIQCYGNVIAYYSDKRLKNIEGRIQNPLDKIQKLNGVYYTQGDLAESFGYEKNDTKQVGLIAQEVQEVLPEIVSIAPIDKDGNGGSKTGENYLTIDYSKVVPLLVECIKELKSEIEELKKNR